MFISKKKYIKEKDQAWTDGYNRGLYDGEQKGRKERVTTKDIQNALGKYLVSNKLPNDNLLTRHSSWVTRTKIYDSHTDTIFVWCECAECGKRVGNRMFKTEDWDNYHKERWNPTDLPRFCDNCGSIMDEEE